MSITPGLFRLDRRSKLPLYVQIERNLRELILNGQLEPGQAVPPEWELAEFYGVNRLTVRRALDDLARQNWLTRRHGIGTFVERPAVAKIAGDYLSFTRQMEAIGRQPSSQLIEINTVAASRQIARRLRLEQGEMLVNIVRLRLADETPLLLEHTYLPQAKFPGLDRGIILGSCSLYALLAERFGVAITRTDLSLKPALLTAEQAQWLHSPPGSPTILSEIVGYANDEPVEYTWSVVNGEHSEFWFSFQRREGISALGTPDDPLIHSRI